jgi:DNA topoisomerase III
LKYRATTTKFQIGEETFTNTSSVLIDPGFTKVMTWQAFGKNELISPFSANDVVKINEMKLVESQTGPPDYLTESELITLMEKHGIYFLFFFSIQKRIGFYGFFCFNVGIGTDASIPVHINNISQRNYVQLASGRKLIPTTLGIVLVHGYQKVKQI